MRIVHEIIWERGPEVAGRTRVSADPPDLYLGACHEEPRYRGARVRVTLFSGNSFNNDEVVLEGSLDDVRAALREALDALDDIDGRYKAEFEDHVKHARPCPACGTWRDMRGSPAGHADGCGNTCLADGTVLIAARPIETPADGGWQDFPFENLKEGAVFRIKEPVGEHEVGREFVALEDARPPFHAGAYLPSVRPAVRVLRNP